MSGPPKIGECVYCGVVGPLTRDHIPPKNLFAKPRPNKLISVPSCRGCNLGGSADDTYLQLVLTLREDTHMHPDVQRIWPSVFRSLSRPQQEQFTRSFLGTLHTVSRRTPAGIHLGDAVAFDADLGRLNSVVARVTKGLFYHELGYRLPDEFTAVAYSESGFTDEHSEVLREIRDKVIARLVTCAPRVIGNRVFAYRWMLVDNDPNVSACS